VSLLDGEFPDRVPDWEFLVLDDPCDGFCIDDLEVSRGFCWLDAGAVPFSSPVSVEVKV